MTIDAATKHAVIDACTAALKRGYIFEDTAARMADALQARESAGAYDKVTSSAAFARQLTEDLQAVSHDKHLRVFYRADASGEKASPSPEERTQHESMDRRANYGFERVERLEGNVGYLDLRMLAATTPRAQEVASAAMTFLAETDALIIDLRRNGGGSPHMIAYVSSYLFDDRTHLNDLYWRAAGRTDEFWTDPAVTGRKFGGSKPVFVLTSHDTFSGAEEFAYNLQSLKRATIVGETTGGGAHPGGEERVGDHFVLWLPRGRAINPVTRTNWEGTGVVPDVAVTADVALERAKELARAALHRPG
jgi:C-terminal processing protease CtpA/Prc